MITVLLGLVNHELRETADGPLVDVVSKAQQRLLCEDGVDVCRTGLGVVALKVLGVKVVVGSMITPLLQLIHDALVLACIRRAEVCRKETQDIG